jgi:hypothetical protein
MTKPHKIRCRFCNWETLAFWTGKDGSTKSGMTKLRAHIELAHPEEAERIFDQTDGGYDD